MTIILITVIMTIIAVTIVLNFATAEKKIEHRLKRLYGIHDSAFLRAMGVLLGPAIVGGNRVEVLINGDRIFPAMLAAIRGATISIPFESFIYWSGTTGETFAKALVERARAGVKVHLLVDWLGSNRMEKRLLDAMKEGGRGNTALPSTPLAQTGATQQSHTPQGIGRRRNHRVHWRCWHL